MSKAFVPQESHRPSSTSRSIHLWCFEKGLSYSDHGPDRGLGIYQANGSMTTPLSVMSTGWGGEMHCGSIY